MTEMLELGHEARTHGCVGDCLRGCNRSDRLLRNLRRAGLEQAVLMKRRKSTEFIMALGVKAPDQGRIYAYNLYLSHHRLAIP
jgi:hypothetical protein